MKTDQYDFMAVRDSFKAVLSNSDDRVIIRDLLVELMPNDLKWEIVWRFNKHVCERNIRVVHLVRAERTGVS